MRVLIVGEGKHELSGALEELVTRLVSAPIKVETDRLARNDIHAFHGKGKGYLKKAVRWMMEAERRGFDAIVLVVDEDGVKERRQQIESAQGNHAVKIQRALGVAVRTFDAWMIADEVSLTRVLGAIVLRSPQPESIRDPKQHVETLIKERDQSVSLADLYRDVAKEADLAVLQERCPEGFAPFAKRVQARSTHRRRRRVKVRHFDSTSSPRRPCESPLRCSGCRPHSTLAGDAVLILCMTLGLALTAGEDAYRLESIAIPDAVVLEVGGMDFLADGRLAVCSRRGEVWLVANPCGRPQDVRFKRFASGLHEPLGLSVRDGRIYVVQRGELTCLVDEDHDDRADVYATVCDAWSLSGNYHEYAYGPKFDAAGNAWVTLNLAHDSIMTSPVPWRGWAVTVTPQGTMIPVAAGLRSPAGLGMDADGNVFYADNQGEWVGACRLTHLQPGDFAGHPASLAWCSLAGSPLANPGEPPVDQTMFAVKQAMPALKLPAVWFPYKRMGQSASDIVCDRTGGVFGPFAGQLFVGDQTTSEVMRVFLERVQGEFQGACFPFRSGFDCGIVRLAFAADGSLFAGMTSRGWASRGNQPYALQRLVYAGNVPCELRAMRAASDGFDLEFTAPVDRATASEPRSYALKSFTYEYHPAYGSPEIDTQLLVVESASMTADGRHAHLKVSPLREGYVHELDLSQVRRADGAPLAHHVAYYTLNHIPLAATAPTSRSSGQ